jgi:DNA-binding response OmpR family regulator
VGKSQSSDWIVLESAEKPRKSVLAQEIRRILISSIAIHFGAFALDVSARQLLHHGDVVHLSPKAFQVLTILIARYSG